MGMLRHLELAERADDLCKSPVVAHSIDTPREPYASTVPFPMYDGLMGTTRRSPRLSAVMAAANGKEELEQEFRLSRYVGPGGARKAPKPAATRRTASDPERSVAFRAAVLRRRALPARSGRSLRLLFVRCIGA